MTEIVPLARMAPPAVEALLDAAFGADRHGRTAYRLREGLSAIPALSFAARDGGQLIGTLQSWPVVLATPEGLRAPLTLVGPVAVRPDLQRGGTGKALMAALIEAAAAHGHDALTMIGDPEYYDRFFGFTNAATGGWALPGPFEQRRLLARISRPGGLPARGMIGPDPAFLEKPIAA
jgi:predicted N-acetyltransferase YhbS